MIVFSNEIYACKKRYMKYNFLKISLTVLIITVACCHSWAQKKVTIFKPTETASWYTYTTKTGKNNDPKKVFQFEGNVLHVSGEDFGYIVTEKKYADFHLTLEFKWDKIWPRSLEYQIQEGDCGDFWMTDSTTIISNGVLTKPGNWIRVIKTADAEKPNGEWNKIEVIVKDGSITHLLNGKVVNTGQLRNTTTGNIVLQSEGAELYYRNVTIKEL